MRPFEKGRQVSVAMTRIASHGDRSVHHAAAYHVERLADRVRRGRTRARHREGRPLDVVLHADMAAGGVQHQARNRKRMNILTPLGVDPVIALVERLLAADAGADEAGHMLGLLAFEGEPRVGDRLARRHHGELAKPVEQGELLRGKMRLWVEILDLGPNLDVQVAGVDDRQRADDRAAIANRFPKLRHGLSGRAEDAEAGDDNSVHGVRLFRIIVAARTKGPIDQPFSSISF